MDTVKLVVVSTQDVFRAGLITIVGSSPSIEVVGDSSKLVNVTQTIAANSPDLVILDLHGCNLMQDSPKLSHIKHSSASRLIVVTSSSTDFELTQCIQSGVNGIVCRNAARGELITAVRTVLAGRSHYCSHTSKILKKVGGKDALTKRELEVLQFLALGLPNKEIARMLAIGIGTIKTHLININSKLQVSTRTEAVIRGVQQRLISI